MSPRRGRPVFDQAVFEARITEALDNTDPIDDLLQVGRRPGAAREDEPVSDEASAAPESSAGSEQAAGSPEVAGPSRSEVAVQRRPARVPGAPEVAPAEPAQGEAPRQAGRARSGGSEESGGAGSESPPRHRRVPRQAHVVSRATTTAPAGEEAAPQRPPGLTAKAAIPIDSSTKAKLSCKVPRRLEARLRAYQQEVFERYDTRLVRSALFAEAVRCLLDLPPAVAEVLDARAVAGPPREPMVLVTTEMPGELYKDLLRAVSRDGRGLPYSALFVSALESYLSQLEHALDAEQRGGGEAALAAG